MEPLGCLVHKAGRRTHQMLVLHRPSVAHSLQHPLTSRELFLYLSNAAMPPSTRRRSPSKWLPLYLDAHFQRLLEYESDHRFAREFPSLSGNPQTQYQNPGQAVWGNSNQRVVQHTPVQRPQPQQPPSQQNNAQQQHQQTSQAPDQPQRSREDLYAGSQFAGSNDDYHRGGQGGVGQLGASSQPQPSSVDDFPPLGRNGADESQHDRRGSLMQNAAFGGFSNSNAFSLPPNHSQARHNSQPDSGRSSTLVDRITSPSSLSFGEYPIFQGVASYPDSHSIIIKQARHHIDRRARQECKPILSREWPLRI